MQVTMNHALLVALIHKPDYTFRIDILNQVQRLTAKGARDENVLLQSGERPVFAKREVLHHWN